MVFLKKKGKPKKKALRWSKFLIFSYLNPLTVTGQKVWAGWLIQKSDLARASNAKIRSSLQYQRMLNYIIK